MLGNRMGMRRHVDVAGARGSSTARRKGVKRRAYLGPAPPAPGTVHPKHLAERGSCCPSRARPTAAHSYTAEM